MLPYPPPGPARRRFVALCVAAAIALVVGIAVGASGGSEKTQPASVEGTKPPAHAVAKAHCLPLARQIGEILMISFRGTTPPGYAQRALRQGRATGVILFRANAPNPSTTRALTQRLQRAGRGR